MRYFYLILFSAFILVLLSFVFISPVIESGINYPGEKVLASFSKNELPIGYNDHFAGSGECVLCHSSMVNNSGESISIVNDWRSSMMGNSAKDPFWRAKVSHETLVNPEHAEELEDVCIRCHAPMGYFDAHLGGQLLYSIAEMENDPLALDGISCTVCHQIKPESLGNYSGDILFGLEKKIWGPYADPFSNPMINHTGYTPVEGDHIKDSRLCGSCHSLVTNTVDLNGVPTGTQFVEQAIYHEWLNSGYAGAEISCQSCHVPEIEDEVVISSMPPWLEGRTPFGMHHFAGANVFMLQLMKENIGELGLTTTEVQMDSTISRAKRMLQTRALKLEVLDAGRTLDSLFVDISLMNKSGHKFPSGYPSRRAYISLIVINEAGDTIFYSGTSDEDYNLLEEDEGFETHFSTIYDQSQVQIYELVMGNVNYEPTTVLEQAFVPLKDNRIPPVGFTSAHPSYDTVKVAGNALQDDNFNRYQGAEGTGKDIVHYRIATMGNTQPLTVKVAVHYQTVTAKWLQQMFEYSSEEIDAFKSFFEEADKEPVLVAEEIFESVFASIRAFQNNLFAISPNPAGDYIHVEGLEGIREVVFYDMNGIKQISGGYELAGEKCYKVKTPHKNGLVILCCKDKNGVTYSRKIVLK